MNATQAVIDALHGVTFGPAAVFDNLSVIPLLAPDERVPDYLTLDEALRQRVIEIDEIHGDGSVPELKVANRAGRTVLLVDGEELIGAKQNRVLNLTVLVPARRETVIPVSCVEAGRWRRVSGRFSSAPRVQFAEGRAAKMRDVTASMRQGRSRRSDQGEVWSRIADKAARLEVCSSTSAMSDIFDTVEKSIEEYVAAFPSAERQAGAVFVVDGRPAGLELFDSPVTWRKLAPKLLRSYALDALDRRRSRGEGASNGASNGAAAPADGIGGAAPTPRGEERAFVSALMMSAASVFPGVGEGEDVRLTGPSLAGAALVANGRAVHVSAFSLLDA